MHPDQHAPVSRDCTWMILLCGLLLAAVSVARGQVVVSKSASEKITIDVSGLEASSGTQAQLCFATLRSNLERSGWFRIGRPGASAYRVLGSITETRGGDLRVQSSVFETAGQRRVFAQTYREPGDRARAVAHRLADDIVEAITGQKGIASTRIVLVGTRTGHKELYICDADGGQMIQLTNDRGISVAPRWGPRGDVIVYTAYLRRFPDLYTIHLPTGRRERLAAYPGLNTGAVLSPDGSEAALILSKDGNPELYVKHLASGRLTRLTRTPRAVEASPSWSPDGRRIVYVSDTSGRPQLYVISRDGGAPRRLTRRGSESVAPDWGSNGIIAFSCRIGRQYQVGLIDPETGTDRYLALDGADYEDPSWAPNGRHLVLTRKVQYRSQVYILDTMTEALLPLTSGSGEWYSPDWSPK